MSTNIELIRIGNILYTPNIGIKVLKIRNEKDLENFIKSSEVKIVITEVDL